MSREELIKRVKEIIAQEAKISLNGVQLETRLEDINIDSLDMIEVALALEKSFNITIVTTELLQFETFGDVIAELERKLSHS
jgi:acyl carrier protein